MSDLVFFTSNRGKLAHFKYIGTQLGVPISGFREKVFYASYHEPQLDDREALLRESYESALSQWKRKYGEDDSGLFFLEDTSVRIDGLSAEVDVPGVHVKYWMRDMDFEKLDRLIIDSGGNRSASVRSDIVLHIPERFRAALRIEEPFLWFHDETQGHVVNGEVAIKPNLLYPWLDNRTFNRWFVPNGFEVPISCLSISAANTVDFRFLAFRKAVDFLRGAGIIKLESKKNSVQLPLSRIPKPPPIIVLCGYSCAGKTRLAQWLRDAHEYMHLEASDFMYQAFWRRHGPLTSIRIGDFAESALAQDPAVVPTAIANQVRSDRYLKVVVSGFRSAQEIQELKRLFSPDREVQVVFLAASQSIRFGRALERGREDVTDTAFKNRDQQESRMGLDQIPLAPDCLTLVNEKSLAALFAQFSMRFGFACTIQNGGISRVAERELEDLILLSLFDNDEQRGFTTTEIAELVNCKFAQVKSKNNVSRYFIQDFHAYYEARLENRKLRYRLSNTGVSRALYLQRAGTYVVNQRRPPTKPPRIEPELF